MTGYTGINLISENIFVYPIIPVNFFLHFNFLYFVSSGRQTVSCNVSNDFAKSV
jgi:hypothetical protein